MLAGGYFGGLLHASGSSTGGSFYGIGKAGVSMFLTPRFSLAFAAGYGYYHEVYQGLQVTLGTTMRLTGKGSGPIPNELVLSIFPGNLPAKGYREDHPTCSLSVSSRCSSSTTTPTRWAASR